MPDTEYIPTWHPLFIPRSDSDPPTGMLMSTTPSPHYPRDQRNTAARREQTTGSPQGAVSRNAKCRKAYRNKKCREAYRNKMSKGIPKLRPNVERHPPYTLATYQVSSLGGETLPKITRDRKQTLRHLPPPHTPEKIADRQHLLTCSP